MDAKTTVQQHPERLTVHASHATDGKTVKGSDASGLLFERVIAFSAKESDGQNPRCMIILVVLQPKTRDRWQMALGILRLLVSARSWVLGTALLVENVGSKRILHGEIRAGLAGGTSPPLEPARLQRAAQSQEESWTLFQSVMPRCGRRPMARSQRRVVVEQPTAHLERKQLEQEVAALSKLESAYQRQHKAAVDSCDCWRKTGDKVKEQKTRSAPGVCGWQRWRCPGKPARTVQVVGEDVATLLSLLAAAIRKGQQQCHLPSGTRNQDLEPFLATLGQMHSFCPGPQVPATPRAQASQPAAPHNAVPASIPTTIPGFPGAAGGRVGCGGIELWCSWLFSCFQRPSRCHSTSWCYSSGGRGVNSRS